MKAEEIENNKIIIAEFMGVDQLDIDAWLETNSNLHYHTSWDWLMPVIENIDHLRHEPVMSIEKALSTRSIDDTYKAVVEFIKNNQKQNKMINQDKILLNELIDFECYIRNILDNKELTDKQIVKLIKEKL